MRPKNSTNQRLINIHRSREANEDRFTTFTYQAKQIKHIGKTYVGAKKPEDQTVNAPSTARVEKKDEKLLGDQTEQQQLIELE